MPEKPMIDCQRKIYTVGQAARILGLSPKKVQMLCDNGDLAGYKIPSASNGHEHRRIREDSVLEFLASKGYVFTPNGNDVVIPENGFLSTGNAAKLMGVCPRTVVNYLQKGIFNGYSFGNRKIHRVCRDSLMESLAETNTIEFISPETLRKYGFNLDEKAVA